MNRKLLLFILFSAISNGMFSQLASDISALNIGSVDLNEEIRVSVLNQTRGLISCYSLNSDGNGITHFPVEINPYEEQAINVLSGSVRKGNFSKILVFNSEAGEFSIQIRGKIRASNNKQDCYDFEKKNRSKQIEIRQYNERSKTFNVRIYSKNEKTTLYCSEPDKYPFTHLVFLVDASGSMGGNEKLERIKIHLKDFIEQLRPQDFISIINYNEGSEVSARKISCSELNDIYKVIENLYAGGFTNGNSGIENSVEFLKKEQVPGYTNNLILFTDGDFNLGSGHEEIRRYLLGMHSNLNYKLSVFSIDGNKNNEKSMKSIANSGKGFFANLDDKPSAEITNKLLLEQLAQ